MSAKEPAEFTGAENGKRVLFDHPSAAGMAGLVERGGRIELAYLHEKREKPPRFGATIELEGEQYRVENAQEFRPGNGPPMVKLGISKIAGD